FSCIGTVGLTMGLTPSLTIIGKIILILLMLIGRVGVMTFLWSLTNEKRESGINYPEMNLLVGEKYKSFELEVKIMSVSTIGVLGLGLFGSAVARTLAENNVDVIAIDKNMDHVEEVLDEVPVAIQGDCTKIDHLMEAGCADCDEVIIATAEKLEDSIIAILNLKKLGIEKITVKTKNQDYQEVLLKVGATRVILPEVEIGVQLGIMLANPTVHE